MPKVPAGSGSNVIPMQKPPEEVYLAMAAAQMNMQGQLFEPGPPLDIRSDAQKNMTTPKIANPNDWKGNLEALNKLVKDNPNDEDIIQMRDSLKSRINDPTPLPRSKPRG